MAAFLQDFASCKVGDFAQESDKIGNKLFFMRNSDTARVNNRMKSNVKTDGHPVLGLPIHKTSKQPLRAPLNYIFIVQVLGKYTLR